MEFHIAKAINRQYYFRIVASNGEPLAKSEEYVHLRDCEHAISLIVRDAGSAKIKRVFDNDAHSIFGDIIRNSQIRKP